MKELMEPREALGKAMEKLPKGLLLNTKEEKFNSMVIGWAGFGITWGVPTVTVYVRENRYSKARIDRTGEFTISVPAEKLPPEVLKVCGGKSGRDTDKAAEAGFTLEEPEVIHTPGIREVPLTLECKVLYAQRQDLAAIPENIRTAMYPADVDGTATGANRDPHTAYIAQVVCAYTIQ